MSRISENIKNFRELRRLTQKQFSERLNKSRNVISNWERGENDPDPDTIQQICKILGVTPNQLFGWEPCPDYEAYKNRIVTLQRKIEKLNIERVKIDEEIARARAEMATASGENEVSEHGND